MSRNIKEKFISIAEVVYYDPKSKVQEPMRLKVQVNLTETSVIHNFYLPEWLDTHKDQISNSILKASKNITGESKFRFLKVNKVPFYS